MATIRLGYNAKLYITLSGGQGGTFVEVTNCRDLTLSMTKDEADASSRAGAGWKETVGTLKDLSLEFEMLQDSADTNLAYLRTSFMTPGTALGVKVLDKSTGEGPKFDGEVFEFTRNEPIGGVATVSIKIRPTPSSTAPSWVAAS